MLLRFLTAFALLSPLASPADLVIVASPRSGAIELSREQAEKLYLGRTTTLADGTPVKLVDLPSGTTRDEFYLKLTNKNPSQILAYRSRLVFTGPQCRQRPDVGSRPGTAHGQHGGDDADLVPGGA